MGYFCRIIFLFFALLTNHAFSQELYPLSEPASNVPKGVLGVRLFAENYKQAGQPRNMGGLRLMYGITPKLTLLVNATASNHHDKQLPRDLITHTHIGNQTIFYTNKINLGKSYPYRFGGFHFYSKYRYLTIDGDGTHFRAAVYGEYSLVKTAHDEAETDLMEDNGGYGGGFLFTLLHKKLAVSLTTGAAFPKKYQEDAYPTSYSPAVKTELIYGRTLIYNLSFGYLIFPKKYSDYNETNYNVYVEFQGRSYEQLIIIQDREMAKISNPGMLANNYVDVHLGIQKIIKSNMRIDFTVGLPLYKQSFVQSYPVFHLAIQRYFYL